jgi:hypothetical protein
MGHDRLDPILGSYSVPGIDFLPITGPKIPALTAPARSPVAGTCWDFVSVLRGPLYLFTVVFTPSHSSHSQSTYFVQPLQQCADEI